MLFSSMLSTQRLSVRPHTYAVIFNMYNFTKTISPYAPPWVPPCLFTDKNKLNFDIISGSLSYQAWFNTKFACRDEKTIRNGHNCASLWGEAWLVLAGGEAIVLWARADSRRQKGSDLTTGSSRQSTRVPLDGDQILHWSKWCLKWSKIVSRGKPWLLSAVKLI
jgi:hypothetical protein